MVLDELRACDHLVFLFAVLDPYSPCALGLQARGNPCVVPSVREGQLPRDGWLWKGSGL